MVMDDFEGKTVGEGVTPLFPKRRSLVGLAATLRRIAKSIDDYDVMLIAASVKAIKENYAPKKPVEIAALLSHRMLCEEIGRVYGMTYQFPNQFYKTVTRTIGGHKKKVHFCVVVPPLKTIVMPKMYKEMQSKERNNER